MLDEVRCTTEREWVRLGYMLDVEGNINIIGKGEWHIGILAWDTSIPTCVLKQHHIGAFILRLIQLPISLLIIYCLEHPQLRLSCVSVVQLFGWVVYCSKCRAFTPLGLALRWNHVAYVIVRVMFICCGFIIKPLGVSDSFTYLPNGWCLVTS